MEEKTTTPRRGKRDEIAYHEAGHVLGFCLVADGIHLARVLPSGEEIHIDRQGLEVRCKGVVEGRSRFNAHLFDTPFAGYPSEGRDALSEQGCAT